MAAFTDHAVAEDVHLAELKLAIAVDVKKTKQMFNRVLAELELVLEAVRFRRVKLFNHLMELQEVDVLEPRELVLKRVHAVAEILQRNELLQV